MVACLRSVKWFIGIMIMVAVGSAPSFSFPVYTIEKTDHRVSQGQILFLDLETLPGKDSRWEVEISNPGVLILHQKIPVDHLDESSPNDLGITRWEFKALHPGFTQILCRLYSENGNSEFMQGWRVYDLYIHEHTDPTPDLELVDVFHEVAVGTKIRILLEEDASMGYLWDFSDLSIPLIRFDQKTEKDSKKESHSKDLNLTTWDFTAMQAGFAYIHFQYLRTWQCPPLPIEERYIVIHIKE